jgi:hypothetical protein
MANNIGYDGQHSYIGRKVSASLSSARSKREAKLEKSREEQEALCAVASPPSPYLGSLAGWLAVNMCICNGQRSSDISCGKQTPVYLLQMSEGFEIAQAGRFRFLIAVTRFQ